MHRKIHFITNVRLPTPRAHGLQIMKSCEAFSAQGIAVDLVVPRLRPFPPQDPYGYYGVKSSFILHKIPVLELISFQKWLGRLAGYIQNFSFSLCAMVYAAMRGWLWGSGIFYTRDYTTALCMTFLNLKPVVELHDYRSREPRRRIRYILENARMIVVNSEGTLRLLQEHYSLDPSRVIVASNGVDMSFFDIPQSRSEARAALNLPIDPTIIAYVGSLEAVGVEKGVSLLVRAFSKIYQEYPETLLVVVGGPAQSVASCEHLARVAGVPESRIRFVGHIAYTSVPLYLRATDIAVIPLPDSQYGQTTSPIKLFEYLAAGKTTLVSDLPSLRRYLTGGDAEFFTPSDESDLILHLKKLLDDPEYAHALAAQALRVAPRHTWHVRAEKIAKSLYV